MSWATTKKISTPDWLSGVTDAVRTIDRGRAALAIPWRAPAVPPIEGRLPGSDRLTQSLSAEALLRGIAKKILYSADIYLLAHDNLASNTHVVGMNAGSGNLLARGRHPLEVDTGLVPGGPTTYSGVGAVVDKLYGKIPARGPFQHWVETFVGAFLDEGDLNRPPMDPSSEIGGVILTVEGTNSLEVYRRFETLRYLVGMIPAPPEVGVGLASGLDWESIRRGFNPDPPSSFRSVPPDFRKLDITEHLPYLKSLKDWVTREQKLSSSLGKVSFADTVSPDMVGGVGEVASEVLKQIQDYLTFSAELSLSRLTITRAANVEDLVSRILAESNTRPDPFEVLTSGGSPEEVGAVIPAKRALQLQADFPAFRAAPVEDYFVAGVGLFGNPDILEAFFGDMEGPATDWEDGGKPQGPQEINRPEPPPPVEEIPKREGDVYVAPAEPRAGRVSSSVSSRSFGQVLSFSKGLGGDVYPQNTAQIGQGPDGMFLPYVGPGFYPEEFLAGPSALTSLSLTPYPMELGGGPLIEGTTPGTFIGPGTLSHGGMVLDTPGFSDWDPWTLVVETHDGQVVGSAVVWESHGTAAVVKGSLTGVPGATYSVTEKLANYLVAPHQTLTARTRGVFPSYAAAAEVMDVNTGVFSPGGVTVTQSLTTSAREPSGYYELPPSDVSWPIHQLGQFPVPAEPIDQPLPVGVAPSGPWSLDSAVYRGGSQDVDMGTLSFQSYAFPTVTIHNSEAGAPLPFLNLWSDDFVEITLGGVRTISSVADVSDGNSITLDPSEWDSITFTRAVTVAMESQRVVSLQGIPVGPLHPSSPADSGISQAYAHRGHCPPEAGGGGNLSSASWFEIDFPELAPSKTVEDYLPAGVEVTLHVQGDWDTSCIDPVSVDPTATTVLDSLNHRILYIGFGNFVVLERRVDTSSPGKLLYEMVAFLEMESAVTEVTAETLVVSLKVDLNGRLATASVVIGGREVLATFEPQEPFRGYGSSGTQVLIGASPRQVSLLKKTPEMYIDVSGEGTIRLSPGAPPLLLGGHRCLRGS